jgi:hypothetical protein
LLVVTAAAVGWPPAIKVLCVIAVAAHGVARRPRESPRRIVLTADGSCIVPEWNTGPRPLGARTFVCPLWIRLDLGAGQKRRDILLLGDQVSPEAWRRLRALLARTRCD